MYLNGVLSIERMESKESYKVTTNNGESILPSVTYLLQNAGISPIYYNADKQAMFGSIAHDIARLSLIDDLGDYDKSFEPWMVGINKFKEESNVENAIIESAIASIAYGYAGTLDFLGEVTPPPGKGYRDLYNLDWKFWGSKSKKAIKTTDVQTAGYSRAAIEMGLVKRLPKRAVIWFFPGGYEWIPLTSPMAWPVFQSALNCYNWNK